jgi:integrase
VAHYHDSAVSPGYKAAQLRAHASFDSFSSSHGPTSDLADLICAWAVHRRERDGLLAASVRVDVEALLSALRERGRRLKPEDRDRIRRVCRGIIRTSATAPMKAVPIGVSALSRLRERLDLSVLEDLELWAWSLCMSSCGLRWSDVAQLRWEDVAWAHIGAIVKSRSGKTNAVRAYRSVCFMRGVDGPMGWFDPAGALWRLYQRLIRHGRLRERLFRGTPSAYMKHFNSLLRLSGCQGRPLTCHGFRHGTAIDCSMSLSYTDIMSLQNWRDPAMLAEYMGTSPIAALELQRRVNRAAAMRVHDVMDYGKFST